jgi:hypothetical protein
MDVQRRELNLPGLCVGCLATGVALLWGAAVSPTLVLVITLLVLGGITSASGAVLSRSRGLALAPVAERSRRPRCIHR